MDLPEALLDALPGHAALLDARGRVLSANRAWARFEREGALAGAALRAGSDYLAFCRRQAGAGSRPAARVVDGVEAVLEGRGEETVVEYPCPPSPEDTACAWFRLTVRRFADGHQRGGLVLHQDISDQRCMEEELRRRDAELEKEVGARTAELEAINIQLREAQRRQSRQVEKTQRRLVAILEATTDLVGIADVSHYCQYLNRAGRRMLGVGEDEDISAIPITRFYAPRVRESVEAEIMPTAETEGVWWGETLFRGREGRDIPVSQVILVHRDAEGEVEFFSTIARDMTEQKHLEEQLLRYQKMEGLGRLAGGIAHDFNNLLTAITGCAMLLEPELEGNEPALGDLRQILEAAQRASKLTRQLLAFARRQIVESRVVDLNELVLSTDSMLRRLIGEDVELVTVPAAGPLPVKVDPGQFEQILVNLAVNSRDAMPDGGKLIIETRSAVLDRDSSAYSPEVMPGPHAVLVVRDTGTGMTPEVLEHIFEPFFTTKDVGKGTGLGLATCYGIVKQARGHIHVESSPEAGTTFTIFLPCAEGAVDAAVDDAAASAEQGAGTILLVEDEPLVREIAVKSLRRQGYTVLPAAGGCEALALARDHQGDIDLLLTDMVMPQMSGRQVAAKLAASRPDLKILFMSGYAESSALAHEVLSEGAAFLPKPFTPAKLTRKVHEVLRRG